MNICEFVKIDFKYSVMVKIANFSGNECVGSSTKIIPFRIKKDATKFLAEMDKLGRKGSYVFSPYELGFLKTREETLEFLKEYDNQKQEVEAAA